MLFANVLLALARNAPKLILKPARTYHFSSITRVSVHDCLSIERDDMSKEESKGKYLDMVASCLNQGENIIRDFSGDLRNQRGMLTRGKLCIMQVSIRGSDSLF